MRGLPLCLLLCACSKMDSDVPMQGPPDAFVEEPAPTCDAEEERTCSTAWADVDVRGQSPFGEVHITRVGVGYWRGFTGGTSVWLDGSAGTRTLTLRVGVFRGDSEDSNVPPGSYGPGERTSALFSACEQRGDLTATSLELTANAVVGTLASGAPIDFRGTVVVADPGWSLRVPVTLTRACEVWTDL